MGDGIESKYRPPRVFKGFVFSLFLRDRQWPAFQVFLALCYVFKILNNDISVWAIAIIVNIFIGRPRLPISVVLCCTVLLHLISTAFGPIIEVVIRRLSFYSHWGAYLFASYLRLMLVFLLSCGILFLQYFMPEVWFRYKMWKLLDFFLGTERVIKLSDRFRERMPSLAPCNPFLKDAAVSSTQESQFIARSQDWALSMGQKPVLEIHEIKGIALEEPRACSYSFEIGSGQIRVHAFPQNNFKFESRARERLLEEFVTITDWDRIATIFCILRYWEKSPGLGVIENLYVVNGDGIYCHCLSLQSIVEGVCKSREQFSLFKLSESRRFYVGSVPQQNKNSISFCQKLSPFVLTVLGCVSSYFVAEPKVSNAIAIVGILLACFVFIDGPTSEFLFKLFVHWVLVRFCKEKWRYDFYRWLKRKDCFLAFSDDFNPVLHHASESELITLWNCTPGTSLATLVRRLDWGEISVLPHTSSEWQWNGTRFVYSTVLPTPSLSTTVRSLFEPGQDTPGQDFEWHQGQNRYFELTLCRRRTVRALSECVLNDGEAGEAENVVWNTQLQFDDDPVEHLQWKESSYLLFVYLMVKWRTRNFGVISGFRKFWFAQYYHVFSTYELARHIQENAKDDSNIPDSYCILNDEPKPTDMVA